jgi:hypothetical protein
MRSGAASSFRGEICPRRIDRAFQESELDGTLDRLAAHCGTGGVRASLSIPPDAASA